jgi:hypothetical protein
VDFVIKQGPLEGKAVVIVGQSSPTPAKGLRKLQTHHAARKMLQQGPGDDLQCARTFPLITPKSGTSTVFVYHGPAVEQFRKLVLTPFFVGMDSGMELPGSTAGKNKISSDDFLAEVTRVDGFSTPDDYPGHSAPCQSDQRVLC